MALTTDMNTEQIQQLTADPDGLLTYEFIANNIGRIDDDDVKFLVDNMIRVDQTGQFLVSAARYLHAIDPEGFAAAVSHLIAAAIDKDRERRYIGDLLESIYGADYRDRADELSAADDNFRRIYKRIFATGI